VLIASATEKMMKLKDERCEKTFSKCWS